jgi:hypothetical protein
MGAIAAGDQVRDIAMALGLTEDELFREALVTFLREESVRRCNSD